MEYEKKYKDALERASKLRVQNPFDTVSQMMEHIFPELKESEDEKIRKSLMDFFDSANQVGENPMYEYGIQTDEIIKYLEKQGEQKSTDNLTPQEAMDVAVAKCFDEQKSADSYCQKNCKGFQETGKCFADGDCKAKREAESIGKAEPWNIKNAKVGDVLVHNSVVFIFMGLASAE